MAVRFERTDWYTEHEIIIKYKDGSYDWIDPLLQVEESDGTLYVENSCGNIYEYDLSSLDGYNIRITSDENIYDWKGEYNGQ